MIPGLTILLVCQLAGEILARALIPSAPGPVLGMALMLVVLIARDSWRAGAPTSDDGLERTGLGLLGTLSLMFIPAGVGVVQRLDVLGDHGVALIAILIVSTVLALLATAFTFVAVSRIMGRSGAP